MKEAGQKYALTVRNFKDQNPDSKESHPYGPPYLHVFEALLRALTEHSQVPNELKERLAPLIERMRDENVSFHVSTLTQTGSFISLNLFIKSGTLIVIFITRR